MERATISRQQQTQRAFLGAALMDPVRAREYIIKLVPGMFDEGVSRAVFSAVQQLTMAGEPVDVITVINRASAGRPADEIRPGVVAMAETCPSVSNIGSYAAQILEDYRYSLLQGDLMKCMAKDAMDSDCVCRQLRRTLALCRENGVRTYLLGNGSNTLFADEGYDGAVIDLRGLNFGPTAEPQPDGSTRLTAGAGLTLGRLCAVAQQQSLAGLAFACGIPGTIGGAVYMNAGAYGGEMKDVLESVTFLDSDLTERTLPAAELALGYRTSLFEQHPDWCVLSATVRLQPGDGAAILAEMQDYLQRRKDKQPLEWPSAGSTFKRPQGAFAGKLIEDCGLRGFTVGGAQISEKHCGFVINRGGATCADVVALTEQVRQIVEARTGFVLEREIRVVK